MFPFLIESFYRQIVVFFLCCTLTGTFCARAEWISLSNNLGLLNQKPEIIFKSAPFGSQNMRSISIHLSGFEAKTIPMVSIDQHQTFTALSFPLHEGWMNKDENSSFEITTTAEEGMPQLPAISIPLEFSNSDIKSDITILEQKEFSLGELGLEHPLIPYQTSVEKIEGSLQKKHFFQDQKVYHSNVFYPPITAQLKPAGMIREIFFSTLMLYPIQYNPKDKLIRIASKLKVTLLDKKMDSDSSSNNSNHLSSWTTVAGAFYGFLVIVADRFLDFPLFQEFLEWKKSQGFDVHVIKVSAIGKTPKDIRSFIRQLYLKQKDPPLRYVLLVGEHSDIPAYKGAGYTDNYYAAIDQENYEYDKISPDLMVGRLSVKTEAELKIVLEKIFHHQQLTPQSSLFSPQVSFIGTIDTGWWKMVEDAHQYVIDHFTIPLRLRGSFPKPDERGGDKLFGMTHHATTNDLLKTLNEGRSLVHYSGHGWHREWRGPVFKEEHFSHLAHPFARPVIISQACSTNEFAEEDDAFSEMWLKHPYGALAFWGASNLTHWEEDMVLEQSFYRHYYKDPSTPLGFLIQKALLDLSAHYGGKNRTAYYFEVYNLLGDPSMEILTKTLEPLRIDHAKFIRENDSMYSLRVRDGIKPVAGARVLLSQEEVFRAEKNDFKQLAITDAQGMVHLPLGEEIHGDLKLKIIKNGFLNFEEEIPVIAASGPHLKITPAAETETLLSSNTEHTLWFVAKNWGNETAISPKVIAYSKSPYLEIRSSPKIISNEANVIPSETRDLWFDDIAPGQEVKSKSPLWIRTTAHAKDREKLPLELTWNKIISKISFSAKAPSLILKSLRWNDMGSDGGDGYAAPGEELELSILITNDGQTQFGNSELKIHTDSPYLQILQSKMPLEPLAPQETIMKNSLVRISNSIKNGEGAEILFTLTEETGRVESLKGTLLIGLETEKIIGSSFPPQGFNAWPVSLHDKETLISEMIIDQNHPISDFQVFVDIDHEHIGDLKIELISPEGESFALWDEVGGQTGNGNKISGWFGSDLKPFHPLDKLQKRSSMIGKWQLKVSDLSSRHEGKWNGWKIKTRGYF